MPLLESLSLNNQNTLEFKVLFIFRTCNLEKYLVFDECYLILALILEFEADFWKFDF